MLEAILGSIVGSTTRLIPAVLQWLDRKNERKHELDMLNLQKELIQIQTTSKLEQAKIEYDTAAIEALKEAYREQSIQTNSWVDSFSKLIRPLVAFEWLVLVYPSFLAASFLLSIKSGTDPLTAFTTTFGPDEKAICAGLINFYFLDRILKRERRN